MKILNIIIFLLFIASYSCTKKKCQFGGAYQFEIPVTLSPTKETYKIGDTISINSRFSDQVYEAVTDQFYSLADFRFRPTFEANEISDSIINNAALNNFEIIIDTVQYNLTEFIYSSGSVTYNGEYLYQNGEYLLTYKLIPKITGLYEFAQASLGGDLLENQDFPEKCKNKTINIRTILNNRTSNNNIHLAKDSPNEWYNTRIFHKPKERFTYLGKFIFYVEE